MQLDEDQDEVIGLRNKNRKLMADNNSLQQKLIDLQMQQQDEIRKSKHLVSPRCNCGPKIQSQ